MACSLLLALKHSGGQANDRAQTRIAHPQM
jgi:hypothetical protein